MKSLGQIAYEAYCNNTGNKSLVSGAALPTWEDLRQEIRDAWSAAASAVVDAVSYAMDAGRYTCFTGRRSCRLRPCHVCRLITIAPVVPFAIDTEGSR